MDPLEIGTLFSLTDFGLMPFGSKVKTKAKAKLPASSKQNQQDDEEPADEEEPGQDDSGTEPDETSSALSWEGFMEDQPDDVKALFDEHIKGLKDTIKTTRTERDNLSVQLKKLSKDLDKHPELQKTVDDLQKDLDAANQRADFYAEAPGEGCKNIKAAYALALSASLFDSRGLPDWEAIRDEAPELFSKGRTLDTDAGKGTDSSRTRQRKPVSMNDIIRGSIRGSRKN